MNEDTIQVVRRIAERNKTHRETIAELIQFGLAQDAGEADELLRELDYFLDHQTR